MRLQFSALKGIVPLVCGALFTAVADGQVNILTYHVNNARTGLNSQEQTLTPAVVSGGTFGLLYRLQVDGAVYAEPLSVAGVSIPNKGIHNVVYVATEHNSVYAFDANSNVGINAAPLWHVNLGPSVPSSDVGVNDLYPEIGITGTPVIHLVAPGQGYIYLVAKTKETDGQGNTVYVQRLHALNIANGAEPIVGPRVIEATVPGTGDGTDGHGNVTFNPLIQHNRPGLLFFPQGSTGLIVIAWASHGDVGPYHGWVMAYDAYSLRQVAVLNLSPNAVSDSVGLAAAGVWMGGCGIASDGDSFYIATGNGKFDPSNGSWGDSILRLSPSLQVLDSFTPTDQLHLEENDADLGSGGIMIVPNDPVFNPAQSLLVQMGKEGTFRVLNMANLGGYNTTADNIYQELNGVTGGVWGAPAYFNGTIYYGGIGWPMTSFPINSGKIVGTAASSVSANIFGYPGSTPFVSSNGTTGGIVWGIDCSHYAGGASPSSAMLFALDATNLANQLYSSNGITLGVGVKFSTPLVMGGHVFVGTQSEVDVFGVGKFTSNPVVHTPSGNYQNSVTVSVSESTPGAVLYYTLDGSAPSSSSPVMSGPLTIAQNANLEVMAQAPGAQPSGVVGAMYQISPVYGTGSGLLGDYYDQRKTPYGVSPTASEIDPTINFNWAGISPIKGVGADYWCADWTGTIQPLCTTNYTFYTISDDGVRVWINRQEIINNWTNHGATLNTSAPVALVGGQKYTIRIDYYQIAGGSSLKLSWSSLGLPREIVPQTQLYSQ